MWRKPGKFPSCDELEDAGFVQFGVHRSNWPGEEVLRILLNSEYGAIIPAERKYTVWVPAAYANEYWAETKSALARASPTGGRARLSRRRV